MNSNKRIRKSLGRKSLSVVLFLSILVMNIFVWAQEAQEEQKVIKESGVQITTLSSMQVAELSKLGKVWGFVKYYHPVVVDGKVDWDRALFEIIPKVLEAKDSKEVNQILYDWIKGLGDVKEGISTSDDLEKVLDSDLEWVLDEGYIGKELSDLLLSISKTYLADHSKGYMYIDEYGYAYLNNEDPYYEMDYSDDGYRLLGLFRYWNIIQYYYPYRMELDHDWNDVLPTFIPKFIEGEDELSYKLSICELETQMQDSHANAWDMNGVLYRYKGTKHLPFKFQIIDGQVVVTQTTSKYAEECMIKPGDIILKQDDKSIYEVIKEREKYISVSHEGAKYGLLRYMILTNEEALNFTIFRDGKEETIEVKAYKDRDLFTSETESHKLLEDNIGYINTSALKPNEIHEIMEVFKDTKGLIVDLRDYPSDTISDSLGTYLVPEATPFVKCSYPNPEQPGSFIINSEMGVGEYNPDYYKGKVMILMNEFSISHSEFTAMALRVAPEALVVGSPSAGADGNIVTIQLPGGVTTYMSGIGVYYPNGSKTQRIGIIPDVYVRPTVEGIKEGRDEVLEKAIELINLPIKASDLKK